jgi:hypothetical protein
MADYNGNLVKGALENAGIEASVVGDHLQMAVGDLPLGWPVSPRVWVRAPDAQPAHALIEHWQANRLQPESVSPAPPWTCPKCGETVDADFDLCWNCQHDRVAT